MPTAEELSYAPLRKIERAIHHIDNLSKEIDSFLAQKPFKLIARIKRRAGRVEYWPKTYKPIPVEFSLIIGDAIHNLASALDVTLYGMAKDRAPSPEKIMFPFPKRASDGSLEGAINNGQVKFAGTKVTDAIRLLKPYLGGHPVLSQLHVLDVRDKHHLLILTRHISSFGADKIGKLTKKYVGIPRIMGPGTLIFTTPEDQPLLRITEVKFVTRNLYSATIRMRTARQSG